MRTRVLSSSVLATGMILAGATTATATGTSASTGTAPAVAAAAAPAHALAPAPAAALRDPTRPPMVAHHATGPVEAAPVLSAIMTSGADRVAIFNGHLVRSGGSVGSYLIQSVFEDGVRYRHAGLTHDVYLPHTVSFKKPTTAPARATAGDP